MITCPLCEHTQAAGDECAQCGKRFTTRPAGGGGDVPRMAELELTPHAGGSAEVHGERMPELEPTGIRAGADLPPVAFPEMERTRMSSGGDVDAPPLQGLDLGREPDDGVRTEIPWGAVTCRECGHQQVEGILCDRCGMRLPAVGPGTAAAEETAAGDGEDVWVRCKCGAKAKAGQRCGNCGEMVAVPA